MERRRLHGPGCGRDELIRSVIPYDVIPRGSEIRRWIQNIEWPYDIEFGKETWMLHRRGTRVLSRNYHYHERSVNHKSGRRALKY